MDLELTGDDIAMLLVVLTEAITAKHDGEEKDELERLEDKLRKAYDDLHKVEN